MDCIVKIYCDGTVQKIDVTDNENEITDYKILNTIHEQIGKSFVIIRYAKIPKPFVVLCNLYEQSRGTKYNIIASHLCDAIIVSDVLIMVEGFRDLDEPDLYYLTEREADEVIEYLKTMR